MPHVAAQMRSGDSPRETFDTRQATITSRRSGELQRPVTPSPRGRRKTTGANQMPSLSLLSMPKNSHWDFGSIRHIREQSSDFTPVSATESVFELPSGRPGDSPDSSIHSLFIAELEDTSPIAVSKQIPNLETPKTKPQTAEISVSSPFSHVANLSHLKNYSSNEILITMGTC